ncbi:MAG: hypothetical protein M3443_07910 [Actinomycetota bacterium]|nr:hypothetical protein [Actinomycetota bacterium]
MRRAPGRPLPSRVQDIASVKINDSTKALIVELLALVRARFGTVTGLIRHAMTAAASERPGWGAGSPTERRHLQAAKGAVSKFLGSSAQHAPSWADTEWIVRACVEGDEHVTVLARIAGHWCAATGETWPPGYTGCVDHGGGDGGVRLTDPETAPDDATRAQLYRERWEAADAELAQLRTERRQLQPQASVTARCLIDLARRAHSAEVTVRRQHDELATAHALLTAERYSHLTQADTDRTRANRRLRAAEERVEETYHHIAVLVAHLITTRPEGSDLDSVELLPVLGLALDAELLDLLDPPISPTAGGIGRWLVVYLRTTLILAHELRVDAAFPNLPEEELATLIVHGQPPTKDTLRAVIAVHPMLRAYGPALLRSAEIERAGTQPTLVPVDLRSPRTQRRQDADTIRFPSPNNRHTPPSSHAFINTAAPHHIPTRPDRQVTVAELFARHNTPTPPRRRARHQRDPAADTSTDTA